MTTQIADVLSLNDPSVYIYGSYVLDGEQVDKELLTAIILMRVA